MFAVKCADLHSSGERLCNELANYEPCDKDGSGVLASCSLQRLKGPFCWPLLMQAEHHSVTQRLQRGASLQVAGCTSERTPSPYGLPPLAYLCKYTNEPVVWNATHLLEPNDARQAAAPFSKWLLSGSSRMLS